MKQWYGMKKGQWLVKPADQKYELKSLFLTRTDYETLREHFRLRYTSFNLGVRRLIYRYMREQGIPIHDAAAKQQLGEE